MMRWTGSVVIGFLLLLTLVLPWTGVGRRGTDEEVRSDIDGAVGTVGETLPPIELFDLDGEPLRLEDLRGHRVLLTFERSVDW